ncbi:response regulator [Methanocalculus taiwanensis]|uniref:histidine kinase n=1 Tax=Methanocalculus taiwanensis TaxID=106207 RepID=A0ABD4TI57_9EURY|nr:response regulator [Methanocalculus taiwanensis]MCQ1537494.1 response regulator [Methanocalculus taiwanensis]
MSDIIQYKIPHPVFDGEKSPMTIARILIVEDEAVTAMAIRKHLTNLGYFVCGIAHNAEIAVRMAGEEMPDLILMDIKLTGRKSGIDVANEIRAKSDIAIIYLTAFSNDNLIEEAKKTEPYGYILKPVREQELKTSIEMALYKHSMEKRLRRSEEEKAAVLNSMPVMLIHIGPDYAIRYANRVAGTYANRDPESLVGARCHEIWQEEADECESCPVIRSIESGSIEEGDVMLPDGRIFHLKGCPVYNELGEPDGAIIFGMDITEEKAAAEALSLAHRKLQILSSITRHDILNEITMIIGYLGILQCSVDERGDPEEKDYTDRIMGASQNIRRQIDFTDQYEELGVKEPAWLSLHDMIRKIPKGDIPIRSDCQDISIYADRMTEKVFYNLYDNTIRHTEGATGIRIHCRRENNDLIILWEDDGGGIPAEYKEKIFNRSFGKNTGFGLFLSREILGITTITIHETGIPGKGARFEIRVPEGRFMIPG